MFRAFIKLFRVRDFPWVVLFALMLLCVFRIGVYVPPAGINQVRLNSHMNNTGGGDARQAVDGLTTKEAAAVAASESAKSTD